MGTNEYGIDLKVVTRLAKELIEFKKINLQICVVIGGGNIFRV